MDSGDDEWFSMFNPSRMFSVATTTSLFLSVWLFKATRKGWIVKRAPLLYFCVYFSSPPTQNSWIRTAEQRFRTCESAAWKTCQLLLCLHAPHSNPPPPERFTHSLPQSPPLLRSCVCYINAAHHIDGILWIQSRVLWRRQLLMLV